MRCTRMLVLLALTLAFAGAYTAQAAGGAALRVELYVAEQGPAPLYRMLPTDPLTVAGFVVFCPTGTDTMQTTISLQAGEPDTTYDVRIVPQLWGTPGQTYTVTTNSQGRATIHIERDIPAPYLASGVALIKAYLQKQGTTIGFATDVPGPSGAHSIDLR